MKDQPISRKWNLAFTLPLLLSGGLGLAQTHQDIHLSNGTLLRIPLADIDSMGLYPAGYAPSATVITGRATLVRSTTAQVGGELLAGGPCERGICWSTEAAPTLADMSTSAGTGSGAFACALNALAPNTLYHARAYATTASGTVYGNDMSFTTDTALYRTGEVISDAQGNTYNTVWINGVHWMAENLRAVTFANGDTIPQVTIGSFWENSTAPAWCAFNNNISYAPTYGLLYNGHVIVDPRNVCPTGWHVASDVEFVDLIEAIDTMMYQNSEVSPRAGGRLKATEPTAWLYPNTGASDEYGFRAVGSGYRNDGNAAFWGLRYHTAFWAAAANAPGQVCTFAIVNDSGRIFKQGPYMPGVLGHSVRCVED